MKFGEKLKKLRLEKQLTQMEVAKAIGMTPRTYLNYELEGRYPRKRETYTKLAEVLGCEVNYLMTEDENFISFASEQYGTRGKRQAEELVQELTGLFAGGELSEPDKDAVFQALQRAYVLCKEVNKKYTRKDFLRDDD